ncbi:hypothetical protein KEM52_003914 [Ascosphaera acerosa]|nr:hypothetical protein KEM52_003914 [Ascosphaera acerosa]
MSMGGASTSGGRTSSSASTLGFTPSTSRQDQSRPSCRGGAGATQRSGLATKVVVRRLPPGLSQDEFFRVLGEEWRAGGPLVDWMSYRTGKVARGLAKPPKPSRAYLHLLDPGQVAVLHDKIRHTQFRDAANTHSDSSLAGAPYVQYAPFARVPKKSRRDRRQGMIDQDPDFIAFLESLTNPIEKHPLDVLADDSQGDKQTITPLIQYMKDKKLKQARAKEDSGKDRQRESKSNKGERTDKGKKSGGLQEKDRATSEKASEMPVQPPIAGADAPRKECAKAVKIAGTTAVVDVSRAKATKGQRHADLAMANMMDAGHKKEKPRALASPQILRREIAAGRLEASSTAKTSRESRCARDKPTTEVSDSTSANVPYNTASKSASATRSASGPAVGGVDDSTSAPPSKNPRSRRDRAKDRAKVKSDKTVATADTTETPEHRSASGGIQPVLKTATGNAPTKSPSRPPGQARLSAPVLTSQAATQAFLKHANPSQGVTEENLHTVFSVFGKVLKAEIDKRKGFAYIHFADSDGLKKAISASPVQVAQSRVVVAERKTAPQIAMARGRASSGSSRSSSSSNGGSTNAAPLTPNQTATTTLTKPQAHAQSQPELQDNAANDAPTQSESQVTKPQSTMRPALAAAASGAMTGNGQSPPVAPRSYRNRHHRGSRHGHRSGMHRTAHGVATPATASGNSVR